MHKETSKSHEDVDFLGGRALKKGENVAKRPPNKAAWPIEYLTRDDLQGITTTEALHITAVVRNDFAFREPSESPTHIESGSAKPQPP